jgi:hypothetical protein
VQGASLFSKRNCWTSLSTSDALFFCDPTETKYSALAVQPADLILSFTQSDEEKEQREHECKDATRTGECHKQEK